MYFALNQIVFMTLFCAFIRRDLVSLLKFPFLSHVQVFSSEMSLVGRVNMSIQLFSYHFRYFINVVFLESFSH